MLFSLLDFEVNHHHSACQKVLYDMRVFKGYFVIVLRNGGKSLVVLGIDLVSK
jgi:hypothetical protein